MPDWARAKETPAASTGEMTSFRQAMARLRVQLFGDEQRNR
jgi:hypothetical protein